MLLKHNAAPNHEIKTWPCEALLLAKPLEHSIPPIPSLVLAAVGCSLQVAHPSPLDPHTSLRFVSLFFSLFRFVLGQERRMGEGAHHPRADQPLKSLDRDRVQPRHPSPCRIQPPGKLTKGAVRLSLGTRLLGRVEDVYQSQSLPGPDSWETRGVPYPREAATETRQLPLRE